MYLGQENILWCNTEMDWSFATMPPIAGEIRSVLTFALPVCVCVCVCVCWGKGFLKFDNTCT